MNSPKNADLSQFQAFQEWQNSQTQEQIMPNPEKKTQVFQKDKSSIEETLALIMKQMAEMKAQIQKQNPKNGSSNQKDWRK